MHKKVATFVLGTALLAGLSARADFSTNFTSVNKTIPDGNPVGVADTETVNVGAGQQITGIDVTLNISGAYNGDLYAYLRNENSGDFAVLLNRVGSTAANPAGYTDGGFNVTFAVGAPNIHLYQAGTYNITAGQLTGTWGIDGRNTDPSKTLDTDPVTTSLTSFYGNDPNGKWTLFLADLSLDGQDATLNSWAIDAITTAVPEPSSCLLMSLAGVFAGVGYFRSRAKV